MPSGRGPWPSVAGVAGRHLQGNRAAGAADVGRERARRRRIDEEIVGLADANLLVQCRPGTPLALYFAALGMDKVEFVRSIAVSFIVYKLAQLAAVGWAGFMTAERLGLSAAAAAIALASFGLGLAVQDRMSQRAFNRAVRWFLAVLGVFLVYRGLA